MHDGNAAVELKDFEEIRDFFYKYTYSYAEVCVK